MEVGIQETYRVSGWKNLKEGIPSISSYKIPFQKYRKSQLYSLDAKGTEEFLMFWDNYAFHLYEITYNHAINKGLSHSISRYNEMYRKTKPEDQIIDCFVGFETSLLKDARPPYESLFPNRGAVLLTGRTDYSRASINEFFTNLYYLRNRIIHSDERISLIVDKMENKDEFKFEHFPINNFRSIKFIKLSRFFLAQTIITYIDSLTNKNTNVHNINRDVIDPEIEN